MSKRREKGSSFRTPRLLAKGSAFQPRAIVSVIALLLALLVLIRIAAYALGVGGKVERGITEGVAPAAGAINRLDNGLLGIFNLFSFSSHLRREARLEGEVALANSKLAEMSAVAQENRELRAILGLSVPERFARVPASVVARSSELWLDYFLIDKGKLDGISVKDLVINQDGLVGEVCEVGANFSKVKMLTNPDFAISAVTGFSRCAGIIKGAGPNLLRLEYVPADASINLREKILTLGIGIDEARRRPAGVLIGYVSKVRKIPGLNTLEVFAEPAIGLRAFRNVIVLKRQ